MTYDAQSDEITAVVSSGQKVEAKTQSGKVRRTKFSNIALSAAGKTGKMTQRLPANAEILRVVTFKVSGTGTLNVGLDTGTATAVASGIAPATAGTVTSILSVSAGNAEVYATAVTAAATFSGYIEWTSGA